MMKQIAGIPQLGLGTVYRTGAAGRDALEMAVGIGYRHLDTAQDYDTEANVGAVVRGSGLDRQAFFVTTKISINNLGPGKVLASLDLSLKSSGLDYFDLTLIHWPPPGDAIAPSVYLSQLAEAEARGMTRRIGVSNFPIRLIEAAIACLGPGRIATNQVELHPYLQNRKLAGFCAANGIVLTCYHPVARGRLRDDPVLMDIARRHGASVEQVALAFEMASGYVVIPASGQRAHLEVNFAAQDVTLDADDMRRIVALDRGRRYIDPPWKPDWD